MVDKGTFETPPPPAATLDPAAQAKAKEEAQKAEERIRKAGGKPPEGPSATAGAPPPADGGSPAFSDMKDFRRWLVEQGKGLKYKNRDGKRVVWSGKGKAGKEVKDYLDGKPGAVMVDVDPATGLEKEPPPPAKGMEGLPLPNTPEYKQRMDFAEEATGHILDFLSAHYQNAHNNPMTPEEKNFGVFMCKWCVFKYADYIQAQPEGMAAGFVAINHMRHTVYISTKTGEPTDHDTWYLEQGMKPPPFKPLLHGMRPPAKRILPSALDDDLES